MNAGLLSRETAVKALAASYDIDDITAELAQCAIGQNGDVTN